MTGRQGTPTWNGRKWGSKMLGTSAWYTAGRRRLRNWFGSGVRSRVTGPLAFLQRINLFVSQNFLRKGGRTSSTNVPSSFTATYVRSSSAVGTATYRGSGKADVHRELPVSPDGLLAASTSTSTKRQHQHQHQHPRQGSRRRRR